MSRFALLGLGLINADGRMEITGRVTLYNAELCQTGTLSPAHRLLSVSVL